MRDNEAAINMPYTAVYLGVGMAALNEAVTAVKQRVPTGYRQPLAYLPDIRRRVGMMSAQLEAARRLLHYSAWLLDVDAPPRETLTAFLKAKYIVGEAVAAATRSALEIGGAHAIFKGSAIERLFRDGATATIMQPHSDVCLAQVGIHELDLDAAAIQPPILPAES
jgi:alkylation response protein AidB-like acyl-CoA dehydrogenase